MLMFVLNCYVGDIEINIFFLFDFPWLTLIFGLRKMITSALRALFKYLNVARL